MNIRNMSNRARVGFAAVVIAALSLAGAGAAVAATSPSPSPWPASQPPVGNSVYLCVNNQNGKVDYVEFRSPLPHQCKHGDTRWAVESAIVPDAVDNDTTPTPVPSSSSSSPAPNPSTSTSSSAPPA